MTDTPTALRLICGHDSRSVDGCLHCEAADEIEQLRAANTKLVCAIDLIRKTLQYAAPQNHEETEP